ncbi:zinc finger and BTB domain-containing protein 44-like isoform X2 [Scylla paramamosain]|uniref:zinc finger and BTB domain-containing protein 44-like isoform X2 n=1 Tax=Scylla paramamosain TaxID=85552 RepID=UPI003082ABB8
MNNNNVNPNTPMAADSLALDTGLPAAGVSGGVGMGVGIVTSGSTRRTSRVWRYFGMVDNCHYICRLCSFVGAYTNTTNMRKHIQHHHPERFQDILDHTRPTSRPYFAGCLPRLRQPLQYQQHSQTHHYSTSLLYPTPMPSKRAMLNKPSEMPYLHGDMRSDLDRNLNVSSHDCSVAAAAQAAAAVTCQASVQEPAANSSYSSVMGHTALSAPEPPINMCEMSPEESKLVKQLLPALAEATDSSTDTDTPSRGLQTAEDRSGSEFSHHNSDDAPIPVSPEHFLSEGNDQDEATPVPPTPNQQHKPESYQLRHNNHLTIVLEALARDESFMDVTLTAQGRSLKAHKSVLSAVSSYFRGVLRDNPCQHPIIIMPRDVRFEELYSIVNYIYKGEMTVAAEDLTSLLKTAEILQVSGLAPSDSSATVNPQTEPLSMGNVRSSSNSSSSVSSCSNIPPVSRASKPIKIPSQSQSTPPARPKSIESMINPADFIDVDMTCVKEEVVSEGEEEKDEHSSKKQCTQPAECSQPSDNTQQTTQCSQPSQCSQPTETEAKDDDEATNQVILGFPSPDEQSFEQPIPSTSSHEAEFRSLGVKSDPEKGFNSHAAKPTDNPQPLQCPHCEEQYRDVESIDSHLRIKHPTKPSFTCKCGRIFTRQIHHQAHTRMCPNSS